MKRIRSLIAGCLISLLVLSLAACSSPNATEPETLPSFELSSLSGDPKMCKLQEISEDRKRFPEWSNFSYFPPTTGSKYFLPHSGEWNVGLVFLDWKDLDGSEEDKTYYLEQTRLVSNWYEESSNSKLSINWRISSEWSELSGKSDDYYASDNEQGSDEERAPFEQWVLDEAVKASDASFDYSNLDVVVLAIPREREVFTTGTQGFSQDTNPGNTRATVIRSDEASIANWVLSGTKFMDDKNRSPSWVHWTHEMGHMMGITGHLNPENPKSSDTYYQNPMYGMGLYADQWSVLRTVEGWNSWMLGWMNDSQVRCVDADSITDDIFEIYESRSKKNNPKMLVIKSGETSALVIESRLWDAKKDNSTKMAQSGFYDSVVMYSLDSSKKMSDGSAMALVPATAEEKWDTGKWPPEAEVFTDIYFKEGDAAEYEGLRIEILRLQGDVNYIRVTR